MSKNDLKNLEVNKSPEVPTESLWEINFADLTEVIQQEVEQAKESVGELTDMDRETIHKQLAELTLGQAAMLETHFENSQNQLLGTVSEAAEAFDIRQQDIAIQNQARTATLEAHSGPRKIKSLAGLAKLSATKVVATKKRVARPNLTPEVMGNRLEMTAENFPVDQYVARWNMISQSDGLALHDLDLKTRLPVGEINISHLEKAISKTKFNHSYLTGPKLKKALTAKINAMRVNFKVFNNN